MKKVATYGCSHNCTEFGGAWGHQLTEKLGVSGEWNSAPGHNLGMHPEILLNNLKNNKYDLIVLQLSSHTRLTTGFRHFDDHNWQWHEFPDNNSARYRDIGMYSWHSRFDDTAFGTPDLDHFKPKYETKGIHQFMMSEIVLSNWNRYHSNHLLWLFTSLCKQFNTKLFVFSWYDPMSTYVLPEWKWMLEEFEYIEQSVVGDKDGFFIKNNINAIPGDAHYDYDAHNRLVNEYLYEPISKCLYT